METKFCKACLEEKELYEFCTSVKTNNKCKKCTLSKNKVNREQLFKIKLKEVKGEEYELIGEYCPKNLNILHKTCGNIWKTTSDNVFKRNCGFCRLKNKSSISSKFEELLIKNSICFKSEITFDECRNKNKLPFDYGIYDCSGNLLFLVEIDGEQHFKETGYSKGGLVEVQKRDLIKTNFCLDNNIILHRIPYYNENNIKNIFDFIIKDIDGCCEKEYIGYISKSIITEDLAKIIRIKYLKAKSSIKSISRELNISEPTITKVIYYHYFPNTLLKLKDKISQKSKKLKRKNRFFTELSDTEKKEIIEMKKRGITDTEIASVYNVYRKGFKGYFENWDNIAPSGCKKGVPKSVKHIETGLEFESLKLACDYFNYKYDNESSNLRRDSKIKKFTYLTTNNMENQQHL